MTRAARVAFALLLVATFAAFFVAQRLKRAPPVLREVERTRLFSPNGDGVQDVGRISFRLRSRDEVSVAIVDVDGRRVKTLVRSRRAGPRRPVRLVWRGDVEGGGRAPDGLYRLSIVLHGQGRSVTPPHALRVDTAPPRPVVVSVGPQPNPGPELLEPGRGAVTASFRGPTRAAPEFLVFRTDAAGPPRVVARFQGRPGEPRGTWDGRLESGALAPPGVYLIAIRVRDAAGNVGTAPARLPPRPGEVDGHPGVTVRRLAAQPPLAPVPAGAPVEFFVDARGHPYSWSVRRVGARRAVQRGRARRARLALRAPRGVSGVYLLELRVPGALVRVPFLVQSRRRANVLLVLPAVTWLGADRVDDDGDGLPNTLATGAPVRVPRVIGGDGLPAGFREEAAPVLVHLDRRRLRYDLTTDLALERDPAPLDPASRPGVLLPASARWLTPNVARALRRYVRGGGTVASFGTQALRRSVELRAEGLARPTAPAAADVFGARIRPPERGRQDLVATRDDIGLFAGTDGLLSGFTLREETASVGRHGRLVASAGVEPDVPVVVGYRFGRGLVLRTGLPEWTARLSRDPKVAEVTRRVWTLLSR